MLLRCSEFPTPNRMLFMLFPFSLLACIRHIITARAGRLFNYWHNITFAFYLLPFAFYLLYITWLI